MKSAKCENCHRKIKGTVFVDKKARGFCCKFCRDQYNQILHADERDYTPDGCKIKNGGRIQ